MFETSIGKKECVRLPVSEVPAYMCLTSHKNEECRPGRILSDITHNQWPNLTCSANGKAVLRGGRPIVHGDVWIPVACDQINYFLTSTAGVFCYDFFM